MRSPVTGVVSLLLLFVVIIIGYSSVFTVAQTEQVLLVRLGEPIRVVTEPGLNFKAPFIDTVISIDKRILDLENPSQEVIAADSRRLVVDAFRDVQAAQADAQRAQNEAQGYANRVVPEARGRASQILQVAEGYNEQAVAEAKGQSARFEKVYDEYKKAPDVTRQRIYLETMERILGPSEKLIYEGGQSGQGGVVPFLPLGYLAPRRQPQATAGQPQQGGNR